MESEVIRTIAVAACPVLVGIIGLFIRALAVRIMVKVESGERATLIMGKDIEVLTEKMKAISHIGLEWTAMKQEVNYMLAEIKSLKSSLEDVVILKRDQQTMWRRLDELREDLKGQKS